MDELLFRSSQRAEALQIKLGLIAAQSKDVFHQYAEHGKSSIIQVWNSPKSTEAREVLQQIWLHVTEVASTLKYKVHFYIHPSRLYALLLRSRWSRRDVCFAIAGLCIGGIIGFSIGIAYRKPRAPERYMQAVQCRLYSESENVSVVEDAFAPYKCGDNMILVDVRASSVQIIDTKICNGYGRTLRKFLRRCYEDAKSDLPIILGRDCSGIVTDVGKKVTRIEIGDEVWLAMPFWAQGVLSQTVLVPEFRVGKKPKNVGFEGASSVPYSGCLALNALDQSNITFENAQEKRVLVYGGCSPVGCVLVQILKHWGADVTTTCNKRAVPVAKALGSDEVIIYDDNVHGDPEEFEIFKKELLSKEKFDVVISTIEGADLSDVSWCRRFVSTTADEIDSDNYGFLGRTFLRLYIWIRWRIETVAGFTLNRYDEAHLCHTTLDRLSDLVKNGHLQTVVDKVHVPHDFDLALSHIQSPNSIGSTVITFR